MKRMAELYSRENSSSGEERKIRQGKPGAGGRRGRKRVYELGCWGERRGNKNFKKTCFLTFLYAAFSRKLQ